MSTVNGRKSAHHPPVLEDRSPLGLARAFTRQHHADDRAVLLVHWRGEFFTFRRHVYQKIEAEDLRADLYEFLEAQTVVAGMGRSRRAGPYAPTARRVSEVLDALRSLVQARVVSMPAWLQHAATRPAPSNLIAFQNGLLDVEKYVRDDDARLMPPSPEWFSVNVVPVRFEPGTDCPRWRAYLDEVLDADAQRICLLQDFFGYLLTQSTSLQKLLLLIGPPRSGKGTVLRVLRRVVGENNVVSCGLSTIAQQFGLMPLLGKTVAICPDVHLGRGADSILVLERLKSIVGEDAQMVERKHLDALPSVRLPIRFVLAANEFPRLPDASAAMRSRLLPLPFFNSYEGREDRSIDARLAPEIAGVILWSLEGLRRLNRRCEFELPDVSADLLTRFARLSSPVIGFVEDCCKVEPSQWVAVDAVWSAWQAWCKENGHEPGAKNTFGEHLRAAVPGLSRVRKREEGGGRAPVYHGMELTYESVPGVPS